MKPVTHLIVVALAALTPLTAAWPEWLPERDALVVRQEESEPSSGGTPTPTPTRQNTGRQTTTNSDSNNSEEEGGPTTTGRTTRSDLNTAKVPTGSESITRPTSVDELAPAGGVVMITPAPTDPGLKLYKIGNNVTFGWNYTDLIIKPTAIDVLASCSEISRTWTLTQNMTWETLGSFVWETEQQATNVQNPLLTEEYTLVIYEADTEMTDTPKAGHLGAFNSFKFSMYKPQEYQPLDKWVCPTCSAAPPSLGSKALGLALTMSVAAILGLTLL